MPVDRANLPVDQWIAPQARYRGQLLHPPTSADATVSSSEDSGAGQPKGDGNTARTARGVSWQPVKAGKPI